MYLYKYRAGKDSENKEENSKGKGKWLSYGRVRWGVIILWRMTKLNLLIEMKNDTGRWKGY